MPPFFNFSIYGMAIYLKRWLNRKDIKISESTLYFIRNLMPLPADITIAELYKPVNI